MFHLKTNPTFKQSATRYNPDYNVYPYVSLEGGDIPNFSGTAPWLFENPLLNLELSLSYELCLELMCLISWQKPITTPVQTTSKTSTNQQKISVTGNCIPID